MYTTNEIIEWYRKGVAYKKLSINELVEVSTDRIDELALEYNIKKSDYGVAKDPTHKYVQEVRSKTNIFS